MQERTAQKFQLGHRTRVEAAAEELRRRILDGEFPEGFQLRQDALAAEFGISRIPIREALFQLEAEGLVIIHPHRGAIVSALSAAEVGEIYALRTKSGLTQKQLAAMVGTTDSVISRLEDADYRGHSLKMLLRICAALNRQLEIRFLPIRPRRKTA